jgi:phage terminase large subunit
MELQIRHSKVFTANAEALENDSIRFIINQGGSRSSKTYSICQLLIIYALTNEKKTISIVRKSFPSLRGSVMRDLIGILDELGLYDERNHHKGENLYKFNNGSVIEFFSVDDAQKIRGRKRDVLYCNEANELTFEDFNQLNMRTEYKVFLDYNPSDNYSWVYDIAIKENSTFIKSTYKDNPFLADSIVKEIEGLINIDEGYYKVYALGEQATLKTQIYNHFKYESFVDGTDFLYGLDIGYNHPTALVKISYVDNKIYAKEEIYSSNLTTNDLIKRMDELNIDKKKEIIVDSARPDVIEDLRRNGYNAKSANKAVKEGIDAVKSFELSVDPSSLNMIKELRNYKWKTSGDIILDEPVKIYDDIADALRYAIYFHYLRTKKKGRTDFGFTMINI